MDAKMKGDLISRSALLERLAFKRMGSVERYTYPGLESAIAQVKKAPAVDAETVCEQMGLVKEALDMAKSNLAPVIRCKDCYRWMKAKANRSGNLVCPKSGMEIIATDYCSKAERK